MFKLLKELNENLTLINQRLTVIETRLTNIESELNGVKKSTKNMDEHIGFVESVYERVQQPFNSLMDFTQNRLYLLSN